MSAVSLAKPSALSPDSSFKCSALYPTHFCKMLFLLPLLLCVSASAGVILPPPRANVSDVGLLIVPGAGIYPEQYLALGRDLQNSCGLRLWVAIVGDFLTATPNSLQIDAKIDETLAELHLKGLPQRAPIAVAGHSLGGVFLPGHVRRRPRRYSATVLLASYLPLGALANFPTPVLHLSGDLDGQTRMTRILRTFQELQTLLSEAGSPDEIKKLMASRPVILMSGQNHGQFATPPLPAYVRSNDIPSKMFAPTARRNIAKLVDAFLMANLEDKPISRGILFNAYALTYQLLQPFIEAEAMDADYERSIVSEEAQRRVIEALPGTTTLRIDSSISDKLKEFIIAKPSISDDESNMTVSTATYVGRPINIMDLSIDPVTANQLFVKMKRRGAVAMALGIEDEKTPEVTCRDLNTMILQKAEKLASKEAMKRYVASGRTVKFLDDEASWTGPTWVYRSLQLTYGADLEVRSPVLLTKPSRWLPSGYEGMQYCKLLPLTRALEWIYVDALKPFRK